MTQELIVLQISDRLIPPLIFLFFVLFGIGWLLPRLWTGLEWVVWRFSLGRSTAGQLVRAYALKDIQLLIRQKEVDDGATRPLAVILAMITRFIEFPRMRRDLKRLKAEKADQMFEEAIDNLNNGWRSGMPPQILGGYVRIITESAQDKTISHRSRLRGRCAVANVKYLLGSLREGNKLAERNWKEAEDFEREDESELKWMASYAYFNSTMFLGKFETAMEMMADQWSEHYAELDEGPKERIRTRLSNKLTLNPVLSIPRHIILAAAFNETPIYEEKYWPSSTVFKKLPGEERNDEIKWAQCWYQEGQDICADEIISLDFSHAYTGFYFTLLLTENKQSPALIGKIEEIFEQIQETSPIVSRYAKFGFSGIYKLVLDQDKEALDYLRRAAEYAAISGNKFADCLFMCCHAVAAAKLSSSFLEPEVTYYLKEAAKLANTIGGNFYPELCAGAFAAVCDLHGDRGKAERYAERSRQGRAGKRILSIFRKEG